jgi:peptide/nickel transport system substrate-binding protein
MEVKVHPHNYERYPQFQSSFYYGSIKSIAATDKYTVTVTLKHRDPSVKYLFAFEGPVFEKKFQDAHKATMGRPGVGIMASGPWKVDSFDPTSGMELTANPHWWGGKVNMQHISVKFFNPGAETTIALAMRSGALDMWTPTNAQAFTAAAGSGVRVQSSASKWSLGVIYMNTRLAPWNDVHVRRAVAYAIDRSQIVKAWNPSAVPTYTTIPPDQLATLGTAAQVKAALKGVPLNMHSVAKAKAELAKSAYPNGFNTTTECVNYGKFPDACQVVAAQLKAIGINMAVNVDDIGKWLGIIITLDKKYGLMLSEYNWPNPDPSGFPGVIFGKTPSGAPSTENGPNYAPPDFEQLIASASQATNKAKRLALYSKYLKVVGSQVPIIPEFLDSFSIALVRKFSWPGFNQLTYGGPFALYIKSS